MAQRSTRGRLLLGPGLSNSRRSLAGRCDPTTQPASSSVYLLLVLAIAWGALLVMVHHFTPILKSIYEIRGVQVAPLVQGLDQIQQWSFLWGPGIPVVALLTYLVSRRWGAKIRKESHATRVLSWALAEALANHRTPREALGIAGRVFGVRPEQLQIGGQGIVSMEQLSSSTQQEKSSVSRIGYRGVMLANGRDAKRFWRLAFSWVQRPLWLSFIYVSVYCQRFGCSKV